MTTMTSMTSTSPTRAQYPGINKVKNSVFVMVLILTSACSSTILNIFPTKIDAQITATDDINRDAQGRPSPLVLRIYELKSTQAFDKLGFFQLYDDELASLGGDLLAREEYELVPGEVKRLRFKPHEQTRYVGVVGAFRNIDQAQWRSITELKLNKNNELVVTIDKENISVKKH